MADRHTVLVVDSDEGDLNRLARLLSERGHAVITACGAAEALALIVDERPDLLLLDVLMPERGGLALCRRLKQEEATRRLPIILMSASPFGDLDGGSGADAVIRKPFAREELLMWTELLLGAWQVPSSKSEAL